MNTSQPSSGSRVATVFTVAQARAYGLRRKAATVVAVCLAVFLGFHVVFGHNGLTAFEKKRQEARLLQAETDQLRQQNDRLRGHVQRLQTDPGAIEHQAREELHYTRQGEVIYTLPAESKSNSQKN